MQKSLGQIAYEAYREHAKVIFIDAAAPLAQWDDLPFEVQESWEAVADAVTAALLNKPMELSE